MNSSIMFDYVFKKIVGKPRPEGTSSPVDLISESFEDLKEDEDQTFLECQFCNSKVLMESIN